MNARTERGPGFLRDLARVASWHRRLLAAGLAAAAVAAALHVLEPAPPPTVDVVTAARDLPGGARVTAGDLRRRALPASAVPDGALREATAALGRLLAAPLRAGEPVTDVRLLGPSLVGTYGTEVVAVPVRMADAGAVEVLRVGDRIDVLAAGTQPTDADGAVEAHVLAAAAPVVALPAPDGGGPLGEGGLVVLAVPGADAARIAAGEVHARLSFVVRPLEPARRAASQDGAPRPGPA